MEYVDAIIVWHYLDIEIERNERNERKMEEINRDT